MSYYEDYAPFDDESVYDDGSEWSYVSRTNEKKVKDYMAEMSKDKLRYKITRNISKFESIKKNVQIIIFASGQQGTTIRNAVTGIRYEGHQVGSRNEYNYYKVLLCTGEVGGRDPVTLFYESADQYERHMNGSINQNNNYNNNKRKRGQYGRA
jgi:hypothetical protein